MFFVTSRPAGVDRQQQQREQDRRDDQRRLAQRPAHRAPRDRSPISRERLERRITHAAPPRGRRPASSSPSERAAGLGQEHVVERRRVQLQVRDREALGVERAHDLRRATRCRRPAGPPRPWARRPRARRSARAPPSIAPRSSGLAGIASSVERPISAFSACGVPSATIRPWSMIPTRSASTSASSRYCVVRKTVTPSSLRQPRDLRPQRAAALRVQARRRLVEEQDRAAGARARAPGRAGASCRPSSRRPCGRPRRSARRARAARRRARRALGLREAVQPALELDVLAAGEEVVERGLLERGADRAGAPRGPAWTTSKPATRRAAGRRRQQRREHEDRRGLAGAVGPEEAVDLARLRPAARCRRPRGCRP